MSFAELPGWTFEIDEVSAGVYKVIGTDAEGHRVQMKGTDPESLIAEARLGASKRLTSTEGAQQFA